jgi:hypothetical protein
MYCKLNWMIKELLDSKKMKYPGKNWQEKRTKWRKGKEKIRKNVMPGRDSVYSYKREWKKERDMV